MENLPDGCFVRLNASIMREGSFGDCLASFVGKFENRTTFVCSDGGRITLSDEQCEMDSLAQDMVVELVGQCLGPDSVAVFVVRELSSDTDLSVYNKMIEVQHNPKFSKFFKPAEVTQW